MEWLSLMSGRAGQGWLEAGVLIGLFWAALAHPDRIRSVAEFRLSALCLGLAIITPVLIQVFLIGHPGGRPGAATGGIETAMYASAIPPVLTMLAVLLGLDSVMPRRSRIDA